MTELYQRDTGGVKLTKKEDEILQWDEEIFYGSAKDQCLQSLANKNMPSVESLSLYTTGGAVGQQAKNWWTQYGKVAYEDLIQKSERKILKKVQVC